MAPSATAPGAVPGPHPATSSEPDGPSPSLIRDSSFTKTSQELIQFVTTLRALGAQVFLDLPRIVVIGNQSAGKSSLVEAISGISVPRDAGTCTRCPMECRLAHSRDAWSCQISIRWEYDDAGEHLDEVQEIPFGPRLTDKSQVEPMLRRAQGAILNAASVTALAQYVDNPIEYGGKANGRRKALAFSRNTICVDLAGPDLVDLSFVDLPGIVQNAEADVVRLVEDLVTSYVGGNCLILVALPMSDDIENQKAARIAKHADPGGLRTIGVLTKPDTIPAGSTKRRQMWLDVIEGRNEEHALQHGYFCTRQPDDDQRLAKISPAEARAAETAFFRTTEPWSASVCPHRYGTQNLVKSISELLTRIISDSLPRLIGEVAAQLAAINKQLDTLPPLVTTEPSAFVLDLVARFRNDVVELTEGSPRHTGLVQKNRETYEKFKLAIRGTAPAFVPREKAKREKKNERWGLGTRDVREHVRAAVTRELPNNIPYPAKKSLIREYQETWETHALACFHRVEDEFRKSLGDLIKQRFERFHHLKGIIGQAVMEQVAMCSTETLRYVKKLLTYESSAPFTQNTHYLMDKRHKQLGQYKQARSGMPSTTQTTRDVEDEDEDEDILKLVSSSPGKDRFGFAVPRPVKTLSEKEKDTLKSALAELVRLGFPVAEEDLGKLHPPDEYEEELEVMAEVRAYFQVSYKRIIDYVPLAIDEDLLYALAGKLQSVLIEKLGLGSAKADARCAAYIAEDPHVVSLRAELMAKKKKLEAVQRALFNFGL
ncbi:P-loop containing nucleoside triphosphate hydrolase protein [Trametes maxima]|nr:P-loop containing nucleoside triphosphate hydrolase protein [Trametes maxima]